MLNGRNKGKTTPNILPTMQIRYVVDFELIKSHHTVSMPID